MLLSYIQTQLFIIKKLCRNSSHAYRRKSYRRKRKKGTFMMFIIIYHYGKNQVASADRILSHAEGGRLCMFQLHWWDFV